MRKYRILKPVMLSFLTPQDQYDTIISPENDAVLESDNHTIWIITKTGARKESTTRANAIDLWLENGSVTEILEEKQ